jgi:hypothetical protein
MSVDEVEASKSADVVAAPKAHRLFLDWLWVIVRLIALVVLPWWALGLNEAERQKYGRGIGNFLALVGVVVSIAAVLIFFSNEPASTAQVPPGVGQSAVGHARPNPWLLSLLAGWAIIPPLWFLAEWAHFSPATDAIQRGTDLLRRQQMVDEFKYSQASSRAVWVAVLAVLSVLFGVSLSAGGGGGG